MLKRKLNDKCRYYISALVLLSSNFVISSFVPASQTHAIDYQTQVTPTFTVNDALSMTVSSDILSIDDLAPGLSKDSNIIDITVASNNLTGYTLRAAVGDSTYNNTDLTNSADGTTFTSLTAEAATLADIASDKWGYSFCQGTGCSSWSSYNGLPLYSVATATLKATDGASAGDTVRFKVAAKAGSTKAAGTYENRISFSVTANPILYMQNVSTWAGTIIPNNGDTATAIDTRDNKEYMVGRLADGKIWMLDNLAFDGTNGDGVTYITMTSSNTNLPSGTTKTWTDEILWTSSYSYTAPKINSTNKDVIPTDATSKAGGYKVGVYYNYCAAVVEQTGVCVDSLSGYSQGATVATQSVCPANWRLPTGGSSGEFQTLYSNSSYNSYAKIRAGLHLPLSGSFDDGSAYGQGSYGGFWSSSYYSTTDMYGLYLSTSAVYPQGGDDRYNGLSIRCVASV